MTASKSDWKTRVLAARDVQDRFGAPKTEKVEHVDSVAGLDDIESMIDDVRDAAEMIGPAKTLPT